MSKPATPPAKKLASWADRKARTDFALSAGPQIARKLANHAVSIHKGDESGLPDFYVNALELKKHYPQYGSFINRAITTIKYPASRHILDRIEWMVERNADPSMFYNIPLKV